MSSSGLGSLILRSKGVMQNGDVWIPATPEKPVLQRPNHGQQPEVTQNQMLGSDNWNDLVGLYTGFLQEPSDGTHQMGNPNNLVGPNSREYSMRQQQQQLSVPTRVPGLSQGLNTRDVRRMENYTGVLQSGSCVMPPQKLNPGNIVSLNNREHNIRLQQQHSNPIGLPGLSHGLSTLNNREHNIRLHKQHSNPIGLPGMSHGLNILNNREHNIRPQQQHSGATGLSGLSHGLNSRSVGHIENYNGQSQNFNPNGNIEGSNVTHVQNMGEIVPQKVNSLAELMGMMSSMHDPTPNGALGRSTYAVGKPGTVCPQPQGVSNNGDYTSRDAMLQQDHVLHANRDNGGYNLQETPNCKLSTPFWPNLNLPPRPEVRQSSSAPRPLQIGPVTPDQQKQSNNHQTNLVPHLLIDEISAQETHNKQDNVVLSSPPGILEREQNELLQNSSGGGNEGIDLNTTPQQKTHKKRKHRPKVVVEGKPKKTPKRSTAKKSNTTPEGNPTPKRKYVRKNGVKTSNTPLTDPALVVEGSNEEPPAKSCKRVLNFDLDSGAEKEGQGREFHNTEASKLPLNLNLDIHNAEWSTILVGPSTSGIKDGHQNTYRKGKQREITNDFSPSIAKTTPQESQQQEHTVPPPTPRGHPLNAIARSFNVRNASLNKSGALVQLVSRANTSEPNLESRRQAMLQNTMSQLLQDVVDVTEKQESKREYAHTAQGQPQTVPLMGSRLWYPRVHITGHSNGCSSKVSQNESQLWANEVSGTSYSNGVGSKLMQINSETGKKETVEDEINGTLSGQPSGVMSFEDLLGQSQSRDKSSPVESSIVHQRGGSINSCTNGASTSRNSSYISNVTCNWNMNSQDIRHKFQQQRNSSQVNLCAREMVQKTSHQLAKEQTTNYLTQVTNWILESASNRDNTSTLTNEILIPPDRVAVKKRTAGQASSKKVSIMDKNLLQDTKNQRRYWHYSKKVAGSQEMINLFSVDYITDRMNYLNINKDKGKEKVSEEQTALVPFRGEGALIPYEDFDPVKRRRPRPRVDLDPETNRLWNLLMGKEGSETAEAMDSDKQKWWEEERKVFRGRVDSFIARMHLVQGDRRFSKWKGSVVDSVIGVFLTQNVSDHLSSSAFMCLAAKFPLKPKTISPSVADHEVRVTFPDGTTPYDHKMTTEPAYNYSSVTSTEPSEYRAENDMKGKRAFTSNMRADEDLISSQSSSESFVFQPSEDNKSSSGSNSEAEDGWNLSNKQGFLNVSQQAERNAALQQFQFQLMGSAFPDIRPSTSHQQVENPVYRKNLGPATSSSVHPYPFTSSVPHHRSVITPPSDSWPSMSMGLERWEAQILANSGKENMSYLASQIDSVTSSTGVGCLHGNVGCLHDNIGQSAQSSFTERQNFQPSVGHTIPNKNLNLQTDLPDAQRFIKHRQGGIQETSQQESTVLTGPKIPGIQNRSDTITFEPTDMGQVDSSEKAPSKTTTTPNEKKRKAAKEKAEPFDWDFLRKQVLWKAGTRERSKDAMDSLDYEALRAADVREISDTIKERGMNNMLAERIKDFLNRLVRDHEKMDLEWLRDVQPDKAKDYLLSIRGLGLKSVECVRLLTLHHLAFPVDTNVGRIAVRLGWVPLQPLPESLQLHLLELYPVLETIQKYLWPRLCKLDQETLYELHYQMITFGKVFCTKRDPNCNACPMRAECRHFASAFASARLALPGPEERRIVTSTASTSANKSSDVVIKPMALLPGEDNLERGTGLTRNCEPVIEEPTTPEPPIEVSERDIEDAFYEEDPDEIPEIKLSVEEFTTNLQSFMQGHMEMGEADMSKALVALSPGLNSIPTPKLKQVSRLRTEHQVYVLPDSHPLLEGMDRREPDDPSPYLLAIWTPGETADSVQPPESTCCSEEGGFCNKKTCFSCDSRREAQAQTVRGTILIPCRTAMRGSFPLNGTYFQVNEVFADHESSLNPIDVPRSLIWDLPRGTVYFGTSVSTIFKGLPTEGIQYCFWKGYVCVRGFDQKTRAPRPLKARLHFPASKMVKQNK